MTYVTHIVAREGYMTPQKVIREGVLGEDEEGNAFWKVEPIIEDGEFVTTRALAVTVELETGMSAEGVAEDEDEAKERAAKKLEETIRTHAYLEEEARERAKTDPMVRLARFEALAREHGWNG